MSTTPHSPRLCWSGMTHVGKVRKNNEDSFLALTFDGRQLDYLGKLGESPLAKRDFVFAVSDGMGGAQSGEFASKMAVEKLTKNMPKAFRMAARGMSTGFTDILGEIVGDIHQDLLNLGRSYEECSGMGATLSLCWFTPEWMYYAHIGDSRIYVLPKHGPLKQLTHDHSYVGWLRRQGKLNEREARAHPQRNVLLQALGAGNQTIEPQFGAVSYGAGDRFLLCSDGLTDGLWDHHLADFLGSSEATETLAPRLIAAALENSGRDNLTALAISVL